MPEVIKNSQELLFVNNELVEQIVKEASQSQRHMARLLMHFDHEDPVQEMLIAMGRDCAVMPNQSVGRSESLQVVKGELLLIVFDDDGKVVQRVKMGPYGSDKAFLYRLSSTPWHTMIPLSKIVVVHEVIEGPFINSSDPLPDWIPGDSESLKRFLKEIETQYTPL
jgi:cupin fold WbuC family metalloprotein